MKLNAKNVKSTVLGFLGYCLWSLPLFPQSDSVKLYSNSYAVIIGISDYQSESIPDLDYAREDALSIRDVLIRRFNFSDKNITTLLDRDATLYNMKKVFGHLHDVEDNSCVFFFYAGHGETIALKNGIDMGFLIPHDADNSSQGSLYATCLPMSEMSSLSSFIPSKHVLFMIDACYGGLATVSSRGLHDDTKLYLDKMMKANARQIITAGGKGEKVIEQARLGHSIFTKVLLDALDKGLADLDNDGIIPATELYSYLRKQVSAYSFNQQTPAFRTFTPDEGEFVFLLPPKKEEPLKADIVIHSNVEGASILIDDKETNFRTSDLIKDVRVGKHKAALKFENSIVDREIEVRPDSTNSYEIDFDFGTLAISSNIDSAQIVINGETINRFTPSVLEHLIEGIHTVRVSKNNKVIEKKAYVFAKEANTIQLDFPMGNLKISSNLTGASVWIDQRPTSLVTPAEADRILEGEHIIELRRDKLVAKQSVVVKANQTTDVTLRFETQEAQSGKNKWLYFLVGGVAAGVVTAIILKDKKSSSPIPSPRDFFPTSP